MNMIRKYNPITLLTRAMDATDRWMARMDYVGQHHRTATA